MPHPAEILFAGEAALPVMPVVDHYAGAEKLIRKALQLQQEMAKDAAPLFDLTCDCEDGAPAGAEAEHAAMCAELIMSRDNAFGRAGARIHDVSHPFWRQDIEILLGRAGARLPFITLPKARCAADVATQIAALRAAEQANGLQRQIPVHVLIETHGALREVWAIAALDGVESLDFGLMDFVSAHHGAIAGAAMQSPGQFTQPLVVRAKCEIAAAALANGVVPTHNVTTELSDRALIGQDAAQARSLGFLRMWSIHPLQIAPIIEAMRPDFSEVETACAIILAAQAAAWGPIRHAGKLHDRASYRYYWELIERARATGVDLPDEIRRFFA